MSGWCWPVGYRLRAGLREVVETQAGTTETTTEELTGAPAITNTDRSINDRVADLPGALTAAGSEVHSDSVLINAVCRWLFQTLRVPTSG